MSSTRGSILLVDDEEKILKALGRALLFQVRHCGGRCHSQQQAHSA